MNEERKPVSEETREIDDKALDQVVGGAISTSTATTTKMESEDTDEFRSGGTIGNFISKVGK